MVTNSCGQGGIGHALGAEFRSRGHTVFATVLPHESKEHLTGLGVHALTADVTKDGDIEKLRAHISDATGGTLDILAAVGYTMTAIDTDVVEVEKMFAVNVFGPMRMVHIFHPLLIKARGRILNVGSVGGIVPYVYGSSYNATKAALHHWGNTLRVELRPLGVDVVNVISGEVATNILKRDQGRQLPDSSFYRPLAEEFANHVRRTPRTSSPQEYARSVVDEILKPKPGAWFWTGASSAIVRFGDLFLPRTFWDLLFAREFNLQKLSSK
ncbi:hypothetical protein BDV10DRAFT_198662 [Aspergillus recurvatus]